MTPIDITNEFDVEWCETSVDSLNRQVFYEKYKGKYIKLEGKVGKVTDKREVELVKCEGTWFKDITFKMRDDTMKELLSLHKDDIVTVTGRIYSYEYHELVAVDGKLVSKN